MKSYTCLFVAACAGTTAEAACATTVPVGQYVSVAGSADDCATTPITFTDFRVTVPEGYWVSAAGVAGTATTLGSDVQFTKCTVPTADETVAAACVPGTVADDGSIATAGSNTGVRERQLFPTAHVRHEWKELAFTDTCGSPFEVGVALEGWVTWGAY